MASRVPSQGSSLYRRLNVDHTAGHGIEPPADDGEATAGPDQKIEEEIHRAPASSYVGNLPAEESMTLSTFQERSFRMGPGDRQLMLYLLDRWSPEATQDLPPNRQPLYLPAPFVDAATWVAFVEAAEERREQKRQSSGWLANSWFTSLLKRGYTLAKMASDYLVFPGCSLLLTTGEMLFGQTSVSQWIVGLMASIPLTPLLPLWLEPAKGLTTFRTLGAAAGTAALPLSAQLQSNIVSLCDPSQLQAAYRVAWSPEGQSVISTMSRSQIADALVDIGVGELKSRAISTVFGLDEKPVGPHELRQHEKKLGKAGLWSFANDT